MSSPTELLREKNSLVHEARSILERADRENRSCTVDETRRYDRLMDSAGVLRKEVRVSLPLPQGTREIRAFIPNRPLFELPAGTEQRLIGGDGASTPVGARGTSEYRSSFRKFLTRGVRGLSQIELRALQGDDDTAGGYLIAPEEFVAELLKEQGDTQWIRQLARVFTGVKAAGTGAPKRTAKMNTFAFSSELQQATEDTSLKFGFRKLFPHHITGRIIVSRDLLAQSEIAEEVVRNEMAENKGEVEEQRFMTGHGSGEPLGVFTASADGISTARDVSEDNTTTAPTFDGLKNAKYSLKDQHLRNANWILHRDVIKAVTKIKDGEA